MAVFSPEAQELRRHLLLPFESFSLDEGASAHLFRATVPGDFSAVRAPVVQITTVSDEECRLCEAGGGSALDLIDALTTSIWFRDAAGWRAAWRLVRLIARGRTIHRHDIGEDAALRLHCSRAHYREAV